ncbi:hypothetical protein [Paenibacillus kobensis]|uniref:hypothetical protein n=1 Tax=Paenibacillus kobensis TaxID=59841 RepID=UPI000FD9A61E|nr:hypothetical protein [Paenibacillus kobensis]
MLAAFIREYEGLFYIFILSAIFAASAVTAYTRKYVKVAIALTVAIILAIVAFCFNNPMRNTGDWLLIDGWLFYVTFELLVTPIGLISYLCWLLAYIRKRRRQRSLH